MYCIFKYYLHLISIGQFLKVHRAIFVLALLLVATTSKATTFSAWVNVEASNFLSKYIETLESDKNYRITFKTGNIDPRLNLHQCETPLEFTLQSDPLIRDKNTLKVVCEDKKRWSMFVGVKIDIFKKVWVASQTLSRSHQISASDIELSELQINKSTKGYFVDSKRLIGMKVKRSIRSGGVFHAGLLIPPKVVERGDTVVISAQSSSISVKMFGTALSDGKLGQQISVRNIKSSRVVRATVVSKGKVVVHL